MWGALSRARPSASLSACHGPFLGPVEAERRDAAAAQQALQQQQQQLQLLVLQQQQQQQQQQQAQVQYVYPYVHPPQPPLLAPPPPPPPSQQQLLAAPAAPVGQPAARAQQMILPISDADFPNISAHVPTLELLTGASLSIESGTIEAPAPDGQPQPPQQRLFLVISGTPPQLHSASTLLTRLRAADGGAASTSSNGSFGARA
jgi:hypothetical protein